MNLFSVLITGANRGLGLEFVRQLVDLIKPPEHIFATYRSESTIQKLNEIRKKAPSGVQVHLVKFDVKDSNDLDNLRRIVENTVGEKGLSLLVNNAGVCAELAFPYVTAENLDFHLRVNTIAPVLMVQAFFPSLKKAASLHAASGMSFSKAAVLNISSYGGSIADTSDEITDDTDFVSYKISKAAMNMAMKVIAFMQKEDNVLIINMCPGWVKTDMGTEDADIYPEESVATILSTIPKLNESHHGAFIDRFGNPYRW